MKKITFFKSKMLFKLIAFFGFFLCSGLLSESQAQIAYTQDFSTTAHGWSTAQFSRTTLDVCATTGSLRRNLYSFAATGITASPTIGASNGGVVTLSYQYKVIDYTGGGATPNNFGSFKVQYSTDNATWYDVPGSTISTDHVPATTCETKTLNFSIAPSTATYVRFNSTWADGDYYLYFDEVAISQGAAPSCVSPSGFVASGITSDAATIAWDATATAPSTGYEYYFSSVNTAPSGAGTPTTGLTASLTSLTPNTTYYVWLRSDCGSEQSSWNGPFTFKTACVSFSVPFTEGFNASSSSQDCWTVLNVNGDGDAWDMNYATSPIEGDQSAILYTDGNGGANNDYLISPRITLNGNQRLVFKYKVQSTGEPNDFEVLLSTTGNATTDFTTTLSPLTSYSNTTVETKVISLAGTSGDVYLAWHVPAGGLDGWRLYIDEVVVEDIPAVPPTCSTITSPTTGAINVSNSTVTWTSSLDATGYYVSAGYASGATDVLNLQDVGNVLSYSIPADPATTYYVTVYPYNTFGTATGCIEIDFTTCDEIGDFSENFDALTATGQIPSCWSRVISNGASAFASVGASTTNNSAPYSISLYNSDSPATANIMLVTPYINNIDAGTNRLRFFARNSTASQDIQVGTMSNPADASTFTVLQTVDLGTTFQEYSVSFAGYTGTDKYIAIRRLSTSTYTYVYIDNAVWEAIPAVAPNCVSITSPLNAATNVMNSNVSWASNADATGYRISVGYTSGATDVLNLQDVGNVLSYAFPSDPGTTYFVTVYPYNVTGQASGCTEISFSTCDGLTPDVLETFDTFLPSCWQEADGGNAISGPVSFGTGAWSADGFANAGTTGAFKVNIDYLNDNGWVISPVVSIPTTGYELKFDAAATQWGATTAPTTPWEADDKVEVLVSTSGMTNWTVLATFDAANLPSNTGTNYIIDLDAYAAQDVRFAFRGVEGIVDGGADIDFSVDNFNVRLTPATAPACATVTATPNPTCGNFSNSISWTAASGANGYRITIGTTSGGTTIANNVDLGNVLSYAFTGTIGTTYYYTVVPYNVVGSATGCTEQSFTTNTNGCYCTSVPTSNDASGITNVQIATTNFPTTDVTYFDHTATVVDLSQGINSNLQVTFATGYAYNTFVSIDFNDDFDFNDAGELVYSGVSASANPTTLNASFMMPGTAPLGQHRMRINTGDTSFLTASDPCYSGAYGVTLDFTINIVAASCTPPAATTAVVPACGSGQFSVDVNVTALGSGTPSITDGTTTWPIAAVGVVNVGPFADGASVILTLNHGSDAICNVPLGVFKYSCPPVNDECSGAIALTVNTDLNCAVVTPGTIAAATASAVDATACFGTENDDVWFSFVATATTHNIQLLDVVGSTTDLYHSLWTGADCTALTLVPGTCSDPNLSNPVGLTIGATYYLRVYSWGSSAQTSTFNVCIGTLPPPPANDECSGALGLTVNSDYLCGAVTPGTITSATASAVDTAACGGTENDDVWFSFVATAATHRIELKDVVGSTTDLFHSLWTGADCSALTLVPGTCSDPNTSNPSGLTVGQTYYLRVYSWSAGSKIVNFNVCIGTDPALSANSFDNASFVAYPNPVKDVFNLSYTSEISSVRVLNLLGQEVVSKAVNANSTQIDMSQLSAGTYIVNVTVGDAVKSIKVIKQ